MKLTIFTPTYNRAKHLSSLYESIAKSFDNRTNKKDVVEWLIVDDGSNDNTEEVIRQLSSNVGLEIRYIRKSNGGKHTAFNKAIVESKGDYFVCIDDDDPITENAINDIFKLMKRVSDKGYAGIVGRVEDYSGNVLGPTIFEKNILSNTIEIRDKHNFWGEPEVYFTDILKQYSFKEFSGERFLTEAFLFDLLTSKFPLVYTNMVLQRKQYLDNGLTSNQLKIRIESPRGAEGYYYQRFVLCKGIKNKLKASINRQRFGYWIHGGRPKRSLNVYEIVARPISLVIYIVDKRKYNTTKF